MTPPVDSTPSDPGGSSRRDSPLRGGGSGGGRLVELWNVPLHEKHLHAGVEHHATVGGCVVGRVGGNPHIRLIAVGVGVGVAARELGAGAQAGLAVDPCQMRLDGLDGGEELRGDFAVRAS